MVYVSVRVRSSNCLERIFTSQSSKSITMGQDEWLEMGTERACLGGALIRAPNGHGPMQ